VFLRIYLPISSQLFWRTWSLGFSTCPFSKCPPSFLRFQLFVSYLAWDWSPFLSRVPTPRSGSPPHKSLEGRPPPKEQARATGQRNLQLGGWVVRTAFPPEGITSNAASACIPCPPWCTNQSGVLSLAAWTFARRPPRHASTS